MIPLSDCSGYVVHFDEWLCTELIQACRACFLTLLFQDEDARLNHCLSEEMVSNEDKKSGTFQVQPNINHNALGFACCCGFLFLFWWQYNSQYIEWIIFNGWMIVGQIGKAKSISGSKRERLANLYTFDVTDSLRTTFYCMLYKYTVKKEKRRGRKILVVWSSHTLGCESWTAAAFDIWRQESSWAVPQNQQDLDSRLQAFESHASSMQLLRDNGSTRLWFDSTC